MKAILLSLLALSAMSRAEEIAIPVDELLKRTDAVVVGALAGVSEKTDGGTDRAQGTIKVTEVLSGELSAPQSITLTWTNPSGLVCPRVNHKDTTGVQRIWLLRLGKDGTFTSDSNSREIPLEDREHVIRYLRK